VLVGTRLLPANVAELAALDVSGLRELKSTIAADGRRVTGGRPSRSKEYTRP
jgi:hypothetical protein